MERGIRFRGALAGASILLTVACGDDETNADATSTVSVSGTVGDSTGTGSASLDSTTGGSMTVSDSMTGDSATGTSADTGTDSATDTATSTTTMTSTTDATGTTMASTDGTTTGDSSGTDDGTTGGNQGPIIPETCLQADQGLSTVGCRFYAVDLDSHDLAETLQFAVAVANVQLNQAAEVTIEVKNNGVWQVQAGPTNIDSLDLQTFNLPARSTDDSAVRVGGAYRITSDVPVIAYQFNPVDGATSYLSDASMLYPAPSLDTINHTVAWTSMVDNTSTQQHSYVTVVATADGTEVEVVPSVSTLAGQGVPAGQAGQSFFVDLDEGDVLSVAVTQMGTSMTGTQVFSNDDHPVAVFAGQECALIPANVCCCDHLEEQLSGVRLWGTEFVASRMPVRNAADPEQTLWQIYAAEDDTTITIEHDAGVTGVPALNFMLDKGQMQEFYVDGSVAEPGDFHIVADKPIAVLNYMIGAENLPLNLNTTGDPAAVQISPVEQFLPRYVVLVPGTWVNDVAVLTRTAGNEITIDGVPVDDNLFDPVANSGYEVARVPIPDGVHVLDGGDNPFSVIIVGYDQHDSYAYLGGTGTGIINPTPQ